MHELIVKKKRSMPDSTIVDQCPLHDTLIVLSDFNPTIATEIAGYVLCVGSHGSGTKNVNVFYF